MYHQPSKISFSRRRIEAEELREARKEAKRIYRKRKREEKRIKLQRRASLSTLNLTHNDAFPAPQGMMVDSSAHQHHSSYRPPAAIAYRMRSTSDITGMSSRRTL